MGFMKKRDIIISRVSQAVSLKNLPIQNSILGYFKKIIFQVIY